MLVRQQALPAYNIQTAVDTEHALIVAHAVVIDASDIRCLRPMAEAAKRALGADGFPLSPQLSFVTTSISPRHATLYVLGSMKPKLPAKAIAYLTANLENSRNSNEETLTIAASLLEAAPADASTLHKVLLLVATRSDAGLTSGVLRQLGLSKSRLPEAMDFISANLNQGDPASAVDAVSKLEKDKRALFSSQLIRIASDPAEPQHVRKQATTALQP